MPTVSYDGETTECPRGLPLLKVIPADVTALDQKTDQCGFAICGKCVVKAEGELSEPNDKEHSRLSEEQLADGARLACQARVQGPVEVERHALPQDEA